MPISQALIVQEVDPPAPRPGDGRDAELGSNLLATFSPADPCGGFLLFGWRNAFFRAGLPGW